MALQGQTWQLWGLLEPCWELFLPFLFGEESGTFPPELGAEIPKISRGLHLFRKLGTVKVFWGE